MIQIGMFSLVMSARTKPQHSVCVNTFSSTPAGTTMGLKESECGQMGVIMMAGTLGWIIEAPAATAYAVLPVGVETITPGGDTWGRNEIRKRHHVCVKKSKGVSVILQNKSIEYTNVLENLRHIQACFFPCKCINKMSHCVS